MYERHFEIIKKRKTDKKSLRVCLSEEELRASMLVDRLLGNYSKVRKRWAGGREGEKKKLEYKIWGRKGGEGDSPVSRRGSWPGAGGLFPSWPGCPEASSTAG